MKPTNHAIMCVATLTTVVAFQAISVAEESTEKPEPAPQLDAESIAKADAPPLPSPGIVFKTLSSVGVDPWKDEAAEILTDPAMEKTNYENDALNALNAGVRIANGFVAVQAENLSLLEESSSQAIEFSSDFGLREETLEQVAKARKAAQEGEWNLVRQAAQNIGDELELELESTDRRNLAVLSALGGWLQGLHVAAKVVEGNYSADTSKILVQHMLISVIEKELAALPDDIKSQKAVATIAKAAPKIEELTKPDDSGALSKKQVEELKALSGQLVRAIVE